MRTVVLRALGGTAVSAMGSALGCGDHSTCRRETARRRSAAWPTRPPSARVGARRSSAAGNARILEDSAGALAGATLPALGARLKRFGGYTADVDAVGANTWRTR